MPFSVQLVLLDFNKYFFKSMRIFLNVLLALFLQFPTPYFLHPQEPML